MSGEHRSSYPMGNIHHGTPERPHWGPFCVECKESWPCEVSELLTERDALAVTVARVEALADEWQRLGLPGMTEWDYGQDLRAALDGA